MKQLNRKINLLVMTVFVIMGATFLTKAPNVHADNYKTAPQTVIFGNTYTGELDDLEKNRYNLTMQNAGTVTIKTNMNQSDMTYGPNYYIVNACIEIYDEAGNKLSTEWVEGSPIGSAYFEVSANLNKGNYYFVLTRSSFGIKYDLTTTYKEFPTTSIKKLTNQKGKKLNINWSKKIVVSGYQIQIATNSKFTKSKKNYLIKSAKSTNKTITKLKKSKKYYVRIRTYTETLDGTKAYSKWSKAKTKKITK